ncbi:MAG: diacylglycerol kinase family protein [Parvularculaceae bacterium]
MSSSVGLIINQKSSRSASVVDGLLSVARSFGNVRTMVLDGIDGLDRSLSDFNRAKIDTMIVAGGDGTLQAAFTDSINMHRFDHAPNVVALPCGMTNVIAADCGLKGAPVGSLDHFLWRRKRGDVRKVTRPLMGMTIGEKRPPVYGFFLGAGAFHTAVNYSRQEIQAKGAKRSVAMALTIGGAIVKAATGEGPAEPPMVADIRGEGAPYSGETPLTIAMMTTLRRLVLGIYPFWGAGDAPMAVTTIGFPARKLMSAAPSVLRGKSAAWFREAGYESWRTRAVEMDFEGKFVFDGEFFTADRGERVTIETTHAAGFLM